MLACLIRSEEENAQIILDARKATLSNQDRELGLQATDLPDHGTRLKALQTEHRVRVDRHKEWMDEEYLDVAHDRLDIERDRNRVMGAVTAQPNLTVVFQLNGREQVIDAKSFRRDAGLDAGRSEVAALPDVVEAGGVFLQSAEEERDTCGARVMQEPVGGK